MGVCLKHRGPKWEPGACTSRLKPVPWLSNFALHHLLGNPLNGLPNLPAMQCLPCGPCGCRIFRSKRSNSAGLEVTSILTSEMVASQWGMNGRQGRCVVSGKDTRHMEEQI